MVATWRSMRALSSSPSAEIGSVEPVEPSLNLWTLQRCHAVRLSELVEAVKQTLNIARVVEHVGINAQQRRSWVRPHIDCPLTQEGDDRLAECNRQCNHSSA